MSGERVGKVLEQVARDLYDKVWPGEERRDDDDLIHFKLFLEKRLGPLLRAGQAMRDAIEPWDLRYQDIGVKGHAWDAALAALERER